MKLQRLTGLEREKIAAELKKCHEEIKNITAILSEESQIYGEVVKELEDIKNRFSSTRKTRIERSEEDVVTDKDLIPKEDVLVVLYEDGGVKRTSLQEYRLQKRGGTGLKGVSSERKTSPVQQALVVHTHTTLLILTNRGRMYGLHTFLIPQSSRVSKARSVKNLVNLSPEESVQMIIPVEDFQKEAHLCFVTKKGLFKKSELKVFSNLRRTGVIAVDMEEQDRLVDACISFKEEDIIIFTRKGYCGRFLEGSVRAVGRKAGGLRDFP